MLRPGSWIRPAGGSPVPVGAGAPGSRPRFVMESGGLSGASRASLEGASAWAGIAASSDSQSGSRAAHFTAKAMSASPGSGSGAAGPCGVRRLARAQGLITSYCQMLWMRWRENAQAATVSSMLLSSQSARSLSAATGRRRNAAFEAEAVAPATGRDGARSSRLGTGLRSWPSSRRELLQPSD